MSDSYTTTLAPHPLARLNGLRQAVCPDCPEGARRSKSQWWDFEAPLQQWWVNHRKRWHS